jgi:hypothetical protein
MSNKHVSKIIQAYKDGLINKYMLERLVKTVDSGVTDNLVDELVEHGSNASGVGVDNDDDFTVYFFIDRFADDMLDDTFGTKVSPEERKDLCQFIFNGRNNYKLDDLTDYRLLIHKWLSEKMNKKAYPNTSGKENHEPVQDLDKWIGTLKGVYRSIHSDKMDRANAIDHLTRNWDVDEKQKFTNWMRYYEDGTTEKYAVKNVKLTKHAVDSDPVIPNWMGRRDDRNMSTVKQQAPTAQELKFEEAKRYKEQMLSRIRSLKRLVGKFSDVLPQSNILSIYDEILRLERSLVTLSVYASIEDCIIRSANRIEKMGFGEGASLLKTGDGNLPDMLPSPISNEPNLPPESKPAININMVIDRLEGVSKILKSRDTIRELASIDILLNEMGMASYFPEISYAQSKLIESFSYACNKIEDIVSKLRGSGSASNSTQNKVQNTAPAPQPAAPPINKEKVAPPAEPINTEEIMTKPVGEVATELPKKTGP